MTLILVATVALGLGAAGLVLGLGRLFGLKPPRWVAPVAGGLAMFAFMLWLEYSWFARSRDALPEGARIAETHAYATWMRPWTLLIPRTEAFTEIEIRGGVPETSHIWGFVGYHQQMQDTKRIPVAFDCAARRLAPLSAAGWQALRAGEAPPEPIDWTLATSDAAVLRAACLTPPTEGDP